MMPEVLLYSEGWGHEALILPYSGGEKVFRAFAEGCGHPEWAADEDVEEVLEDFDWLVLVRQDEDGTGLYERDGRYIWIWDRPDALGCYEAAGGWLERDPLIDDLARRINEAETVVDLAAALNDLAAAGQAARTAVEAEIDFSDLAVFGGEEPADTMGIYSWDATRYLVTGRGAKPWMVVERESWDAVEDGAYAIY